MGKRVKVKENEKIGQYLDHTNELKKKAVGHESDVDTICDWCPLNGFQKPGKKTGGTWDQKNLGESDDSTLKIN